MSDTIIVNQCEAIKQKNNERCRKNAAECVDGKWLCTVHKTMTMIDPWHRCEGITDDGDRCEFRAKESVLGRWLCGFHLKPVQAYYADLARYGEYQEREFANAYLAWNTPNLAWRRAQVAKIDRNGDGVTETTSVRVGAELRAIDNELARRRQEVA